MKKHVKRLIGVWLIICCAVTTVTAQEPVTAERDHELLLAAANESLRENKRIAYDFWRIVIEAGQLDKAPQYMTEGYIQHNPKISSGRAAFIEFFSQLGGPSPIQDEISSPLVSILAEGDLVVLVFVAEEPEKDGSPAYTTTWFDMFRVEDGKIAEHWDPAALDN